MAYPSNRVVQYQQQTNDPSKIGQVQAHIIGAPGNGYMPMASNIAYDPFGDIKGLTYGNGLSLVVTRDQRYAPANIGVWSGGYSALSLSYYYDAAGNILEIWNDNDSSRGQYFGYDALNQLNDAASQAYGEYWWSYDALGNRSEEVVKPMNGSTETTSYHYAAGTNMLAGSTTEDPPVSATFSNDVLTLVYPKHHLPQGQPIDDQYLALLNELLGLLDQADQGEKKVKLNYFAARVGEFLIHAQLDDPTIEELLRQQGVPESQWYWFEAGWWKSQRRQDLSQWTPAERNKLRAWAEFMSGITIISWEELDPLLNTWAYSYDAAGSLAGATVGVYQGNTITNVHGNLANNDASHLQAVVINGGTESYAYDHLNRRVVKDSALEQTVYLYDLAGNVIGEASPDGTIKREWVYVGGQRLAMVVPAGGINVCSLAGGAHGAEALLGLMTLVFVGLGWRYRNRKFTVAGLTFLGGVVVLVLMPEAKSQTPTEYIYYYHNDHLGTPRVLTDDQMNIVWDVDYKPFGEVANYLVNDVNQPFRFPGQYADSLSGLSYNWNRYYMPETGRYNRVDPVFAQYSCKLKHPQANWESYNSFHYIFNNPSKGTDIDGLQCSCDNLKRIKNEIENMLQGLYDRTEKLTILGYRGAVQNTDCSWLGWGTTPSNSGFPKGIDCDSPEQNDDCACSITHEFVHCQQCRSGTWRNLGTNEKEVPSYQAQLGCVKSKMQNQCCN